MSIFSRWFGESKPPADEPWWSMCSLTVCVFGEIAATPAVRDLEAAMLDRAGDPQSLARSYQVLSIPEFSEMGFDDKPSRLASELYRITGMVELLLEPGARIPPETAGKVIGVLSDFSRNPALAFLQGRGYHAFVRTEALHEDLLVPGCLAHLCRERGFLAKRVNYISIGHPPDGHFQW